jgi:hypothetical protein
MFSRSSIVLALVLGAMSVAQAAVSPAARAIFEGVWKQAECNQQIENALNNVHYEELGGGYSLGMVLCWGGAYQQSHILFLVVPKTGGRPQLLTFQQWTDNKFEPANVLFMASYEAKTATLTSFMKGRGVGDCGSAGEWTWAGKEFRMTGYWDKPNCDGEEFDRDDRYRVFPSK